MEPKRYTIHRNIGRSITFKGLRAQYILYAGGIVLGDLIVFVIIYLIGVNPWICLLIGFGLGAAGMGILYHCNNRYGEFGLARSRLGRKAPPSIRITTRKTFTKINLPYGKNYGPTIPDPGNRG